MFTWTLLVAQSKAVLMLVSSVVRAMIFRDEADGPRLDRGEQRVLANAGASRPL